MSEARRRRGWLVVSGLLLAALLGGCAPRVLEVGPTASPIAAPVLQPTTAPGATPAAAPPPSAPIGGSPRPAATPTPALSPRATPTAPPALITVSAPVAGQSVRSPFRVEGTASVFEATVSYEVVDPSGRVLARGFTTATAGAPERGSYSALVHYTPPAAPGPATLQVFSASAKDGTHQFLVEVPLRLESAAAPLATEGGTTTVQVFFARPDGTLAPYARQIPKTPSVGRAALEELLRGPTRAEQVAGASGPVPPGTRLLSLKIADGTATADFDAQIQEGLGGAIRVALVRQAIERTLKQFSTVRQVVIAVEGRTEGILQP